jgi:tetratricopeptide (TPR) repeat protein
MEEEVRKTEPSGGKAWPFVMSWTGRISALIGLSASILGGITWFINHHRGSIEREQKMALAASQAKQGEYHASVQTYADILKSDPLDAPALDQQLETTMQWAENFHVLVPEGQDAGNAAGPLLDEMMTILDAGLTRSKGTRASDVQAHIGWAHWLNQKIAAREFGPLAEQNFRAALVADPKNVYANAMLGNWLLQTGGSFADAIRHLDAAVSTGKQRPLVRRMQLGGLIDLDKPGSRAEQVKVANEMRKGGEPMEEYDRSHVLTDCFNTTINDRKELAESLSAVPAEEAWQTYLWLDEKSSDDEQYRRISRDFIQANLLEISGKRAEALAKFRSLQGALKDRSGRMKNEVDDAVKRLAAG